MALEQDDIVKVSNVLNDTKAYNKIGAVLGIDIDNDSQIFQEIEEFIVEKFQEMKEEMEEVYTYQEAFNDWEIIDSSGDYVKSRATEQGCVDWINENK